MTPKEWLLHQTIALMEIVRPNLQALARVMRSICDDYIYHNDQCRKQISALIAGSNYPAISSSDVGKSLVNLPQSYKGRAALMQELLTRKVRIKTLSLLSRSSGQQAP